MKTKKVMWVISLLAVLLVFVMFSGIGLAAEKVIHWKGQNSFAPGPTVGKITKTGYGLAGYIWAEWVKEATNGRLVIDLAAPGAIVPVPEAFNAVKKGVIQVVAPSYGAYYGGTMPEGIIESGPPLAFDSMAEMWTWFSNYGVADILRKAYDKHNIVWFYNILNVNQSIGATFPIDKPEALKGKKIRVPGAQGDLISALGGMPVTVPWGDMYMALKLRTVDGYLGGILALEESKLKEVLPYYLEWPNPNVCATNILINKDAFNALPKDIQHILLRDSERIMAVSGLLTEAADKWVAANSGVKMQRWSAEDTAKVRRMCVEKIYPKLAKPNANTAKLIEITIQFMKDHKKI
jgi:TRAP-type C4-dicarboxylate transport system substrate-binding protein